MIKFTLVLAFIGRFFTPKTNRFEDHFASNNCRYFRIPRFSFNAYFVDNGVGNSVYIEIFGEFVVDGGLTCFSYTVQNNFFRCGRPVRVSHGNIHSHFQTIRLIVALLIIYGLWRSVWHRQWEDRFFPVKTMIDCALDSGMIFRL